MYPFRLLSILYCTWSLLWVKLCGRFMEDIDNADFLCARKYKTGIWLNIQIVTATQLGVSAFYRQACFWNAMKVIQIAFQSWQALRPSQTGIWYVSKAQSKDQIKIWEIFLKSFVNMLFLINNITRAVIILGKVIIEVEQNGNLALELCWMAFKVKWRHLFLKVFTYFPKLKKIFPQMVVLSFLKFQ